MYKSHYDKASKPMKYYIAHALFEQRGMRVNYYASINVTQRLEMFVFSNELSGVYDDNPA